MVSWKNAIHKINNLLYIYEKYRYQEQVLQSDLVSLEKHYLYLLILKENERELSHKLGMISYYGLTGKKNVVNSCAVNKENNPGEWVPQLHPSCFLFAIV